MFNPNNDCPNCGHQSVHITWEQNSHIYLDCTHCGSREEVASQPSETSFFGDYENKHIRPPYKF